MSQVQEYQKMITLKNTNFRLFIIALFASLFFVACGNKGPLYIPKAEKADVAKESDKKKTRTPGDSTAK